MKRSLICIAAAIFAAAPILALATTCNDGGIACTTTAGTGSCGTAGMCVGSQSQTTCAYIHCSSAQPVCVVGPFTAQGCTGDAQCSAGFACISDSGTAGCGTGFSTCAQLASSSGNPTTTTSTFGTSSTSTSTSTSSSTSSSTSTSTSSTTSTSA